MDIDQFLGLPDWRKVELKCTNTKFNSYPIQTQEEENIRRVSILSICAHFAMQNYKYFIENISQATLDGLWPSAMELFVTPKFLNHLPFNILTKYGYCYCCESYQGYNKTSFRTMKTTKQKSIMPLYGICKQAQRNIKQKNLIRVTPFQRCVTWQPLRMYEQIIDYDIKLWFERNYRIYHFEDYQLDLRNIYLFDYLQNNYKA